jgi:hypothetical protein
MTFKLGINAPAYQLDMSCDQFLDVVKQCVIEAFDKPHKQLLMSAKFFLRDTVDNLESNFNMFTEWISYDRTRERTNELEQQYHSIICQYEQALLSAL